MKAKSLKEWIEIYETKTGDSFDLLPGYRLLYMPERGFASMKPDFEGKMMIIYQVCGDAKFWRDYAELVSCTADFECAATICTRHIEPYIRGFGWETIEKEDVNGQLRYWCQDSIGRLVIITHKHNDEKTGEPVYWVTHYFNTKATSPLIEKMKEKLQKEGVLNG